MPIYLFENPETGEIKEIQQRMKGEHVYRDENAVQWRRIFTSPHTSIPLGVNPHSAEDFVGRTKNLKGTTVGEMWDLSKELSQKRKQERGDGFDPIQDKYFKNYAKKRKGLKHQRDPSRGESVEL